MSDELPGDINMPEHFKLLVGDRRLHPKAHLTFEMMEAIVEFLEVGKPSEWMKPIMPDGEGMKELNLDYRFLKHFHNLVGEEDQRNPEYDVISNHLAEMTRIANLPDEEIDDLARLDYQGNEKKIMSKVIDYLKGFIPNVEKTRLINALRGAKFFQPMVAGFYGSSEDVEMKRVRFDDDTFAVAFGQMQEPIPEEIANTDTFLMLDDCLSTGMTQIALLEKKIQQGFRPKKVIMGFTVGTAAGINHLYAEFDRLTTQYGLDCEFIVQCGAICYQVNDEMYLRTADGKLYLVGDMGKMNERVVVSVEAPEA